MHADGKGRLLLVRHTQSVWNSLDLFTGWVDVDLSEKGKLDAKSVGVKIAGVYNVDIAFTSSLVRAQQTLQLVMDGAGIQGTPVTEDWHLNERFYGSWQGKNKTEMKAKYGEDAIQAVRRGYAQRPPAGAAGRLCAAGAGRPAWSWWAAGLRGPRAGMQRCSWRRRRRQQWWWWWWRWRRQCRRVR